MSDPTRLNRSSIKSDSETLAEKLAVEGDQCPIPFTHDRLQETHYWWHEVARNYHEPDPFRFSLGAFIQACRSVTFMLQKERHRFKDFSWYKHWAEEARKDALLSWLHDVRTRYVHQQALAANSWLEMRCIGNPRERYGPDEDGSGSVGSPITFATF